LMIAMMPTFVPCKERSPKFVPQAYSRQKSAYGLAIQQVLGR
jgi:hypothetical protein